MITDISHISDSFGYWFSGFVDGEGCFAIVISSYSPKKERKKNYYNPRFILALRSDDKDIISSVKNILRFGTICFRKGNKKSPNQKPQVRYNVDGTGACSFLVKLFEKYPLKSKKRNDFEIWKQFVTEKLKSSKEQDKTFLEYCFKKLKEVRLYQKPNISLEKPVKIDRQLKLKTGIDLKII